MKKIKSSFILAKIFYYINFRSKFKIIIDNKRIQKTLKINLTDIKRQSGKYIVGERNGKGKEYNSYNDNLLFEGEYLNGKRSGKGKEYNDKGELIFEGEFLRGKRNGKGKSFYKNNKLEFEGEYLNGKRNGKGKEYNVKGELIFVGEYLNGLKWIGKEKENFELKYNKLILESEYLNGYKVNLKGKEFNNYNGKLTFEGEYFENKRNGKGKEYDEEGNIIFEGEYAYEHKIRGKEYFQNGKLKFKGEYL